jgi:hypothetical protein
MIIEYSGKLEVAEKDAPRKKTWIGAVQWCSTLEDGWRLPTRLEFEVMRKHVTNLKEHALYWTSNRCDSSFTWATSVEAWASGVNVIEQPMSKYDLLRVRAVRDVR